MSLKGVRDPVEAYAIPWRNTAPSATATAETATPEAEEAASEATAAARTLADAKPDTVRVKEGSSSAPPAPHPTA